MKSPNVRPRLRVLLAMLTSVALSFHGFGPTSALGASANEINRNVTESLTTLYRKTPDAKVAGRSSRRGAGVPEHRQRRLHYRGPFGDGDLRKGKKTVAYYRSLAASYGFQAGVQAFGYVLVFMDNASLQYLDTERRLALNGSEPGRR